MISFKRYYRQLNESFVKMVRTSRGTMELCMNEPLSRNVINQRGVILYDGTLMTGRSVHDDFDIVHLDLHKAINNIPSLFDQKSGNSGLEWINVQRLENSNRFYLGESYSPEKISKFKEDPSIEIILSKCQKLNPDKQFMNDSIRNVRQGRTIHEI